MIFKQSSKAKGAPDLRDVVTPNRGHGLTEDRKTEKLTTEAKHGGCLHQVREQIDHKSEDRSLKDWVKRALDVLVSGTMLFVLWPVMIVVGALIFMKMGSPVLFRQDRPGLRGEGFEMLKFRTMVDDPNGLIERPEGVVGDSMRVTPFGAFLRSTSLDELPELINVFKGNMSLVGPRPLLMRYMSHYNDHEMRRHEVKPGITGLAQVEGRNDLSWKERFDLDVLYVDNWTILGDIRILFKTLGVALKRDGVDDTVESFDEWMEKRR